ncbi:hypothetical protein ACXR6G_17855 [Ancylomarina sp. YFZ004]
MEYDLRKKYQKKSDKELYLIFSGKKNLGEDASSLAEEELKNRNFDFENIEKYQKKWELEKLIEEDRGSNSFFRSGNYNSKHYLLTGILGVLVWLFFTLDHFFNFINDTSSTTSEVEKYLFPFIFLGMALVSFIG